MLIAGAGAALVEAGVRRACILVRLSLDLDLALRLRISRTGESRSGLVRTFLVQALKAELSEIHIKNPPKV